EAVVDFVGDKSDPLAVRGGDEIAQCLCRHHGTGWIGRTGNEYSLERCPAVCGQQHLRRDRPTRGLRGLDRHRLAAERAQDMPIGRISRQRDRDPIAGLEQCEERENECGRRSSGDDNAPGIDRHAVGFVIVPRDPDASAPAAAAIARAGAAAAGWPTSMWMTRPPAASMRAAAAITSMTMN